MEKQFEYKDYCYWQTEKIESVIIPIGSIEQHGPHACLGTDLIIAEYLASRISINTGIPVMPYIAYGCSDLHMEYTGTISVRENNFKNYIEDVFSSLLRNGVRHVYVYNGHGSNIPQINNAITDVIDQFEESSISIINWWIEGKTLGLFEDNEYHHAGSLETSVLLAIGNGHVYCNRYVDTDVIDYDPYKVKSISQLTSVGSIGTISTASIERGSEYIEGLVDLLIKKYHRI